MQARQRGFTLVELMVVIVIIGILVLIGHPHLSSSVDRAKVASVKVNARTVHTMLAIYGIDNQAMYPASVAGLETEAVAHNYWKAIRNPFDESQPALVDFAGSFTVGGAVGYHKSGANDVRYRLYGSDRQARIIRQGGSEFVLSNG